MGQACGQTPPEPGWGLQAATCAADHLVRTGSNTMRPNPPPWPLEPFRYTQLTQPVPPSFKRSASGTPCHRRRSGPEARRRLPPAARRCQCLGRGAAERKEWETTLADDLELAGQPGPRYGAIDKN